MNKNMNTKPMVSSKHCEEKFSSTVILELNISDKHQVSNKVVQGSSSLSKVQDDESFVLCESMLNELINSSSKVHDNENCVFYESMLNDFINTYQVRRVSKMSPGAGQCS